MTEKKHEIVTDLLDDFFGTAEDWVDNVVDHDNHDESQDPDTLDWIKLGTLPNDVKFNKFSQSILINNKNISIVATEKDSSYKVDTYFGILTYNNTSDKSWTLSADYDLANKFNHWHGYIYSYPLYNPLSPSLLTIYFTNGNYAPKRPEICFMNIDLSQKEPKESILSIDTYDNKYVYFGRSIPGVVRVNDDIHFVGCKQIFKKNDPDPNNPNIFSGGIWLNSFVHAVFNCIKKDFKYIYKNESYGNSIKIGCYLCHLKNKNLLLAIGYDETIYTCNLNDIDINQLHGFHKLSLSESNSNCIEWNKNVINSVDMDYHKLSSHYSQAKKPFDCFSATMTKDEKYLFCVCGSEGNPQYIKILNLLSLTWVNCKKELEIGDGYEYRREKSASQIMVIDHMDDIDKKKLLVSGYIKGLNVLTNINVPMDIQSTIAKMYSQEFIHLIEFVQSGEHCHWCVKLDDLELC